MEWIKNLREKNKGDKKLIGIAVRKRHKNSDEVAYTIYPNWFTDEAECHHFIKKLAEPKKYSRVRWSEGTMKSGKATIRIHDGTILELVPVAGLSRLPTSMEVEEMWHEIDKYIYGTTKPLLITKN